MGCFTSTVNRRERADSHSDRSANATAPTHADDVADGEGAMPQGCRGRGDVTSRQQDGDSGSKVSGGGEEEGHRLREADVVEEEPTLGDVVSSASRCLPRLAD